jgi:hypothetical protein
MLFWTVCPCRCSNKYAENPLFFTTHITVIGVGLCRPFAVGLKTTGDYQVEASPKYISPTRLSFHDILNSPFKYNYSVEVDRKGSEWDFFLLWRNRPAGQDLIIDDWRSHSDATHLAGLLRTSDQTVPETSTWRRTTLTRDRHSCTRRDSNPQSQQTSGLRPTP